MNGHSLRTGPADHDNVKKSFAPAKTPTKISRNQNRQGANPPHGLAGSAMVKPPAVMLNLRIVPDHAGVKKCVEFMTRHFCQPIQVKDLVKLSGMSRRGFVKAFNRHTEANPGAVLRHIRIVHAQRILAEQDLNLKDIAKMCGYKSENTFCVAFQRATGLAPKQFQKQLWLTLGRNLKLTPRPRRPVAPASPPTEFDPRAVIFGIAGLSAGSDS